MRPGLLGAAALSGWPLLAIVGVALLMQFGVAPGLGDDGAYYTKIILDCGIAIMLGVSLTIVNGFSGQFSMGHAAFMPVGGYGAACIMYYGSAKLLGGDGFADPNLHGGMISTMILGRELPEGAKIPLVSMADGLFLVSLLAGGVVAALCGYVVGLPSLRLKGDYLAIVTLGFGEIVRVLIQSQTEDALYDVATIQQTPWWQLPKYLGGPVGFSGLPFYSSLFWVYLFCGVTLLTAYRIKESTFGRALLSIREDEVASESMGVNVTRFKIRAFVISAFFAGIAGGLYAHTVGVQLNAGELGFVKSFDIIIMVVLGGLGSISGAAIAAVILTVLPELLRRPGDMVGVWPYVLGIAVLGAVMFAVGRNKAAGSGRIGFLSRVGKFLLILGAVLLGLSGLAWVGVHYNIELPRYRMVLYALALIMMMILRPKGLLGVREIWDKSLWRALIATGPARGGKKA
jgi:branched-chain amino acid transport system permease protein